MNVVVIDASTALAWCFPDEGSNYADAVLVALEAKTALVPSIWSLEIANALLTGERNKRLHHPDILRFINLLQNLTLVEDVQPMRQRISNVLPLAREYKG